MAWSRAGPSSFQNFGAAERLVGRPVAVAVTGDVAGGRGGQFGDLPVQAIESGQRLGVAGRGALELVHQRGQGGDALFQFAGVAGVALVELGQLLGDAGELEQDGGQAFGFTGHGQLHG